jgi:hypothetical protein
MSFRERGREHSVSQGTIKEHAFHQRTIP